MVDMSMSKSPSFPILELDGSTLEGGGQLIRNSLVLAALTCRSIRIVNIRGNRPKPGLKASHTAGVTFIADLCGATIQGATIGSQEIMFEPPTDKNAMWRAQRKDHSIDLNSPGSIFLIFQAVYPYLLFSSIASPKPITLTITGGTNVTFSPSYEYILQVLLPMLSKLGLPPLAATLNHRGWTTGKTQIGRVTFHITPLADSSLPAFSLTERGRISRFLISILAHGTDVRALLRAEALEAMTSTFADHPAAEIEVFVDQDSGSEKRLYLLIVAESETGCRLGRDWLFDQKMSNPKAAVRKLVKRVVRDLRDEIESGACVDEFMRDQVVLFQALAEGRSRVNAGWMPGEGGGDGGDQVAREPTLHTRTAEWVAKQVLGVRFDDEGVCEGIGLKVGQMFEGVNQGVDDSESLPRELREVALDRDG